MIVVILAFVVLWNFDLHKMLYTKSVSQNAGDAAALMASRWQAISLNLIGDLNVMHALAISADDAAAASAVTSIQSRLCFVGPMVAFMASQQAAKQNGVYPNDGFSRFLKDHANKVRNDYPTAIGPNGDPLFPEPFLHAWEQYADMLDLIADDGVAAGPDNARFFTDYSTDSHVLLQIDFYEAIAGKNWCWFYHNAPTLLDDYQNFFPCWWPPLPPIDPPAPINSEIYSLALRKRTVSLAGLVDIDVMKEMALERGLSTQITTSATEQVATWYTYNDAWSGWDAMSVAGPYPFPAAGPIKPQYDYAGADAAVRVETQTTRLTPAQGGGSLTNVILWTAAAKPFGYLEGDSRPNTFGLVLPAFRDVRLIPVDASSAPSGGGYNLDWRRHIEEHLPEYMAQGPQSSSCWYCQQLVTWENPNFRSEGSVWLQANASQCTASGGGGGGGGGGGRRRGH